MEESSRRLFARYVHVKNWNFLFYSSNIAKSENAMLWRMLSRLETCIVYSCIWSVALAKSIVSRKPWRKLWHSYISKLFLTKMQVKFSIYFHHGSLNVIGDSSEVNWSVDKSINCQFSRFPAWGDWFWWSILRMHEEIC